MNSRRLTHAIALVLIVVMVLPPMARAQTAARAEYAVAAGATSESSPEVLSQFRCSLMMEPMGIVWC